MKVLLVEDTLFFRTYVEQLLANVPDLELDFAHDGEEAVRKTLGADRPTVVLMDLHLPGIGGLEAIRQIMGTRPLPIVVISGHLSRKDLDMTFEAFQAGCVEVLAKPLGITPQHQAAFRDLLLHTLRLMSQVKVIRRYYRDPLPAACQLEPPEPGPSSVDVVAIGASTGGPATLRYLLQSVPAPLPVPIVIVQHIAHGFDAGFCRWLQESTGHPVELVRCEQPLRPETVHVSPADGNLALLSRDRLTVLPPGTARITPNVDILFHSVARHYGDRACGILLTGMGRDGAEGLLQMRRARAWTIAQDEESCIVFGMPAAAIELGAASIVLGERAITEYIQALKHQTQRQR